MLKTSTHINNPRLVSTTHDPQPLVELNSEKNVLQTKRLNSITF